MDWKEEGDRYKKFNDVSMDVRSQNRGFFWGGLRAWLKYTHQLYIYKLNEYYYVNKLYI